MTEYPLLEGKVAIITGGGRGIGAATAELLARVGAAVTVAARTTPEIESVVARIHRAGGRALPVTTDIAQIQQVQAMVEQTLNTFSHIDFVINCAAVMEPLGKPVWESDLVAWQSAMDINLGGIVCLSHAVLPHMLRRGTGRLLVVSSPIGELIQPRASAYASTRAGVNHFVRILAAELFETGVTANLVYPGIVETDGLQKFRAKMFPKARLPFQRRGVPQAPSQVAKLLLWLCSLSTGWINGHTVAMNDPRVQCQLIRFPHRYMQQVQHPWYEYWE